MIHVEDFANYCFDFVALYGPKLVLAAVTLVAGLWIIKIITNAVGRLFKRKEVDASLQPFLKSLINGLLKVLLAISVMSMVGIEMTSFIAILGAAGLAIGMALSGTLQNFAGGVLILILKPFRVGDYIEAQGYSGTVKEIQIFYTVLKTPDNKTVILPNSPLSTGSLINFSIEQQRRLDLKFGIGYSDDIDKAKKVIQDVIDSEASILKDPAPLIAVSELADSSVNFVVRVWVDKADYWTVNFNMHEKIKKTFDKEGVSIPFPQRDIHLYNAQ